MTSTESQQLDVIAVGAHPDDVEIGCGGTLAKLVKQGYRVGVIDLTDGEPTPHSPGPETRLAEAQAAARALGCVPASPFMTMSFLALPVIPALKITDRGLADVERFAFVDLWSV